MRCSGRKHDPMFVYKLDDDVCTTEFWEEEEGPPTILERRRSVFECRLCYQKIYGEYTDRTYQPEPTRIVFRSGEGVEYLYD